MLVNALGRRNGGAGGSQILTLRECLPYQKIVCFQRVRAPQQNSTTFEFSKGGWQCAPKVSPLVSPLSIACAGANLRTRVQFRNSSAGLSRALKNSDGCMSRALMIFKMLTNARLCSPRSMPPM